MDIINLIVRYLTFPGAAFKATLEQLTCRSKKIVVEDVKYFSKGAYCGHVLHEPATSKKDAKAVCMRPFTVNFILGLILLIPSAASLFFLEYYKIGNFLLFWAGISMWANLFPSEGDSLTLNEFAHSEEGSGLTRFTGAVMRSGLWLEKTGLSLITSVIAAFLLAQAVRLALPLFYPLVLSLRSA